MCGTLVHMKHDLIGSPLRDKFKHAHKNRLGRRHFAADLDLCLIEFGNDPFVVALIDYKSYSDNITDAEAVLYLEAMRTWCVPVFIMRSDDMETFDIFRLVDGEVHRTHSDLNFKPVLGNVGWDGIEAWETALRASRRRERALTQKTTCGTM